MSDDSRYINSAQQRVLQMLMRLAGHEINGIAPSELASASIEAQRIAALSMAVFNVV